MADKLTLISAQSRVTPAGVMPRVRRFTVSGIFEMGMSQYDRHIALVSLGDAQALARLDGMVSAVHFKTNDAFRAPEIARRTQNILGPNHRVSDWTKLHRSFFRALELEKLILSIVLSLIVAVAAFNIAATLIMAALEKRSDIATFKTMGLPPARILRIFITQGCALGAAGTFFGVIGGSALSLFLTPLVSRIENLTGLKFLSPDVYPITEVPSQLMFGDVAVTAATAFVLSLLATLYPAWHSSRVPPAEVLKEE